MFITFTYPNIEETGTSNKSIIFILGISWGVKLSTVNFTIVNTYGQ